LRPDVKSFFGGEGIVAVPKAVGQALGNASPLLAPILSAPSTAYSYNPKEEAENVEDPFATGGQISLISAMQARNSARFTVLGSLEMLADKWFDASVKAVGGKSSKTVNRDFARQVTEWTFKEVGVLKVNSMSHHEVESSSASPGNTTQVGILNPTIYRIKNDVVRFPLLPSISS
jgi:oligosaccharyltransferase complex subunit beta